MEFSVLMAVYKNDIPNEVDNAICSVLNQTFSPTEIVIVVDGPVPQALDDLLLFAFKKTEVLEML